MIELPQSIIEELSRRDKFVIPVVELYTRQTVDITSNAAPKDAIARFSNVCFTWVNKEGSFEYEAKVLDWPSVETFLDERVNNAEITLGNAARGETSMTRFVLNNRIKGCWMVIRLVFPRTPDDSHVVWWGKCDKPGEITPEKITLTATQDLGNFKQEIPFRSYIPNCPLEFARVGGGCLGDQTLEEKSIAFRQRFSEFSTAGCNKTFSTCTLLGNDRYFQGQRVVAVSGQFQYITTEEVIKRVLFWTKRKKIQVVKTDNWSSVNQSESDEVVSLAFGRCQIQGHPFTWADVGEQVRSLQGFCEGRISAFTFVRSRTEGINIVQQIEHLGDWGGVGTQGLDNLFNGSSGYNSKLAYLEIVTNGSSPTQVDDAPIITAVIRGLELPVPDSEGNFTLTEWTNLGPYIVRFLLTDLRFGRIPEYRMDDPVCIDTANDCDSLVEDRTNDEAIVLPANMADQYGTGFRRFRSTGRYSAYRDMYENGNVGAAGVERTNAKQLSPSMNLMAPPPDPGTYPEFEEPDVRWFNPFEPYTIPPRKTILRQKYTTNGALQEKTSILDFITKRILPTFKGYINYGANGKIQIKNRRKADNGYTRSATKYGDTRVPITSVAPWRGDRTGYVVIGVSLETAELRTVMGIEYSTACNDLPLTSEVTGTVTVQTSGSFVGGSKSAPALGYVDVSGTVSAEDQVKITIGVGDTSFYITYIADGVEDAPCVARMIASFMNANPQFASQFTAYVLPDSPGRVWVRCEAGYLLVDTPLEYEHGETEEILRVLAVFENCGEVGANASAQFDNFIADSFTWNTDEKDPINAVVAKYTSAIDDFHLTTLMPRAAWDTIDLEGALEKEELDLTFVDNYWQAAYLAKSEAIERIDGNVHFKFVTSLLASRLELGDVVAIRHDSGDGVLNYIPVFVTSVNLNINDFTVELTGQLYLSAAFDPHVQEIDPFLTTTLNPSLNPDIPPSTIGSNGGVSDSPEPVVPRPDHAYYEQFNLSKYSPTGVDIV